MLKKSSGLNLFFDKNFQFVSKNKFSPKKPFLIFKNPKLARLT